MSNHRPMHKVRARQTQEPLLTENDVIEAVCQKLEEVGYDIVERADTSQRGPDIIAHRANPAIEIRVEAKGATSSKEGTPRYGKPFSSSQVLSHVSRALYTAAAEVESQGASLVRSAIAIPKTAQHERYIDPPRTSLQRLDIGVFWVEIDLVIFEAGWSL